MSEGRNRQWQPTHCRADRERISPERGTYSAARGWRLVPNLWLSFDDNAARVDGARRLRSNGSARRCDARRRGSGK